MNNLDRLDRQLLNLMQNDFPLTTQPYLDMARKLDISEEEVLNRIQVYLAKSFKPGNKNIPIIIQ
jgi:DNA-binding Lrp family transcriptional regulator